MYNVSKVCAYNIRETKDAFLLRFSFSHDHFDRSVLKYIYMNILDRFNWDVWIPKKYCLILSSKNGFYLIDDNFFESMEKRISVKVSNDTTKIFKLSRYKSMFISTKLTKDAQKEYNKYVSDAINNKNKELQRVVFSDTVEKTQDLMYNNTISNLEDRHNKHPYDDWRNWHF